MQKNVYGSHVMRWGCLEMKSHRINPMEKDGDESGTVGGIAMRSPPLLPHRTRSRMGNDKNRKGEILYLLIMLASIYKKDGP